MDRFESVNRKFRNLINQGYRQVIKKFNERFKTIDASLDQASVLQEVKDALKKVLKLD
ncbi:hypothetical protein [Mycoplasma sp. ATU-Cv-508]|uniref:hypothetical protein n=1 Tax=Mycoplasma sp. ATU-Cv-508 TaxID=2048001 RepID=UPI001F3F5A83